MKNRDFINQADLDWILQLTRKNKGLKFSFEKGKILQEISVANENLNDISFEDTILKKCKFKNIDLSRVNFYNSKFLDVEFENCEDTEEMEVQLQEKSTYRIIKVIGKNEKDTIEIKGNRRKTKQQTIYDEIKESISQSEIDEIVGKK
ncbi:MAG: pentapeptide repeat-containing protein [Bacteroidetes bacterium]|nr:pentapeptide repeat-containing protein [Bacteroidota bacterium]